MKRNFNTALIALFAVLSLFAFAIAEGGTSDDPVVSKSYVDGTFFKSVTDSAAAKISSFVSGIKTKYLDKIDVAKNFSASSAKTAEKAADAVLIKLQSQGRFLSSTRYMKPKSFSCGDVISGRPGASVMVLSGSFECSDKSVINITQGKEIKSPAALGRTTRFMFPETGGSVRITSKTATVLIDGTYSYIPYNAKYLSEAYALKRLGLVRGAAKGMELTRQNTRAESITMLIRLLGEEEYALSRDYPHPFSDVDKWAQRYVGFAYQRGYTKGVSQTKYDGSSPTSAVQYMTFVLRALGYSESAGDFKYETALNDAVRLGVISSAELEKLNKEPFLRDQVMHVSYLAMRAKIKGEDKTLLAKLSLSGAVSPSAANEFLMN